MNIIFTHAFCVDVIFEESIPQIKKIETYAAYQTIVRTTSNKI